MGKIYLTRHGETKLNLMDCFQGSYDGEDSFLSLTGISQAKALALRLKDIHLDKIYSSPLNRALQTSSYINEYHNLEIIIEPELIERHLGSWEKRNHEEVRKELNLSKEEWIDKSENYLPEDGERLEDFKKRITNIFLKIAKENIDKDVLIVDHVLAIQVISTIIKNEDFNPKIFIPQASLTIINNNINGFEVILDGDISHLK